MYSIAVIGRNLNSDSFEIVFDMLQDGADAGKLTFSKHNWDVAKCPEADGYIFIATKPKCTNKPYTHIMINDSEEIVIDKIQKLGVQLNVGNNNGDVTVDIDNLRMDSKCTDIVGNNDIATSICSITIDINGKVVTLNRDDMESLKEMMRFCSEFGYKIKEVNCE